MWERFHIAKNAGKSRFFGNMSIERKASYLTQNRHIIITGMLFTACKPSDIRCI